jgi:hypothetical protein
LRLKSAFRYQAKASLNAHGAASGTRIPTIWARPARISPAAGPDAVVSMRARRPAIHTSVVSTKIDGMPK